jgi:predicted amidophosphoribosyltransferase
MQRKQHEPRCWSCDRESYDSQYTCPSCQAHGASRGPMPAYALEARRESTQLQEVDP